MLDDVARLYESLKNRGIEFLGYMRDRIIKQEGVKEIGKADTSFTFQYCGRTFKVQCYWKSQSGTQGKIVFVELVYNATSKCMIEELCAETAFDMYAKFGAHPMRATRERVENWIFTQLMDWIEATEGNYYPMGCKSDAE